MRFLTQTLSSQIKIPEATLAQITAAFQENQLPRKTQLVAAGEIARQLVCIETGYLRMYRIDEGKETTVWIGGSGRFITSISSFVDQRPSAWSIESLTDCKIHAIKRDSHFELCERYREWLDFENLLLAKALSALEYRTFELMKLKAEARYQTFFRKHPDMFLHIPSKYIASLLGLSEETLSRLKKKDRAFS